MSVGNAAAKMGVHDCVLQVKATSAATGCDVCNDKLGPVEWSSKECALALGMHLMVRGLLAFIASQSEGLSVWIVRASDDQHRPASPLVHTVGRC